MPINIFWDNPFIGAQFRLRNPGFGCADGRLSRRDIARRADHKLTELDDRDVAGAETVARAVCNRAHRLPHRYVLIRYALYACEVSELHGLAILKIVVFSRTDFAEFRIHINSDLGATEFAPRLLIGNPVPSPSYKVEGRVCVIHGYVQSG